jgi:hypothetical protein
MEILILAAVFIVVLLIAGAGKSVGMEPGSPASAWRAEYERLDMQFNAILRRLIAAKKVEVVQEERKLPRVDAKGDEELGQAVRFGLYAVKRCVSLSSRIPEASFGDPDEFSTLLTLGKEQLQMLETSIAVMRRK